MLRFVFLVFAAVVAASVAYAQNPGVRGNVFMLGHVDGGTLPTTQIGGCVYDVIGGRPLCSDGGSWASISSGGGAASTSELTNQASTPFYDGGTNTLLFAQSIGPCGVPFYVGSSGRPELMGVGFGPSRWVGWQQNTPVAAMLTPGVSINSQAAGGQGTNAFTIGGSYHSTLPFGAFRISTAAANASAGVWITGTNAFRGLNDGGNSTGGFLCVLSGGIGSTDADQRAFFGMYSASAVFLQTTDPSAALNTVYVGCDAANTNMSICSNDGSGTATCTTLGASFPCKAYGYYEFFFCAPPAGTSIGYYVRRLDSRAEASGTISSDLPTPTTLLFPHMEMGTGPTGATAVTEYDSSMACLNLQ